MLQTEYGIQKEREKITEYFEQEMETAAYVDEEVSRLLPLLEDKKFELTSLPEATVLGKPAVGVNVRAKGKPDVKLYFDKQSSLLVKTEYRTIKDVEDHGGEALITYTYDGYREADPAAGDEATLKNAQLPVDGPSLIDYLRKHALGDVDEEDVAVLIRRLGDRSFGVREKATAALIARGQAALPFLQKARKSPDTEVSDRAKRVMRQISATPRNDVLTAVIHLIALRKPAGAAEALLAYLPSAPDANVAAEVRAALAAVAVDNGKPSPIIEKALQDKSPSRRAAAEEVLGKTEPKSRPRQLLLAGVKYPTRVVGYENGKKKSAFAVTEIRFYSSLDPSLFQRP
jgi:broad specificity phosphatase PhoE